MKGGRKMENEKYETKEEALKRINTQQNKLKKVALYIWEQCKSEGLTISEFNIVIDTLKHIVERNTFL